MSFFWFIEKGVQTGCLSGDTRSIEGGVELRGCPPVWRPTASAQLSFPCPALMDLTSRIAALVTALDLELKSVHEEDRVRWSYEERKFELERKAWELERQSWDRERDSWKKLVHKSKQAANEAGSAPSSPNPSLREERRVTVFWPMDEPGELDASTRPNPSAWMC
jgi:hypothetical protein